MIYGIGVDIVKIARLQRWIKNRRLLARFFHPNEVRGGTLRARDAATYFASRIAAKEAFGKALGTGMRFLCLRDIEIRSTQLGKPIITLHGASRSRVSSRDIAAIHLSISHESDKAIAMVVLETP